MFRFGDPGGRMYTSVGTSNANLLSLWTNLTLVSGNIGTASVAAGSGRTTGSCLRLNCNNTAQTLQLSKTLDAQATDGIAFAFRVPAMPQVGGPCAFAKFMDAGSTQVDLRGNFDGTMTVTRNGTALGTTASAVFATNVWVHIELKVKFDPSAGTVYLGINGVQNLNLTSQNTRATANSSANGVAIGSFLQNAWTASINCDFDDIIVYDGQANDPQGNPCITGPIGDCGLSWLLPTGAGTTTQFTPDTGSNFARVNEATPDGDTSYAESSTVGQIDTYAMTDLPAAASSVKSLAVVHYARKTDVGTRGMAAELRTGGTNYQGSTTYSLGNSYLYYFNNWGTNPNTAVAWTTSDVNAIESGQQVTS